MTEREVGASLSLFFEEPREAHRLDVQLRGVARSLHLLERQQDILNLAVLVFELERADLGMFVQAGCRELEPAHMMVEGMSDCKAS